MQPYINNYVLTIKQEKNIFKKLQRDSGHRDKVFFHMRNSLLIIKLKDTSLVKNGINTLLPSFHGTCAFYYKDVAHRITQKIALLLRKDEIVKSEMSFLQQSPICIFSISLS